LVPYDNILTDLAQVQPAALQDIRRDLQETAGLSEELANQVLASPEQAVQICERMIGGHIARARIHMLRLAPYLAFARASGLWAVQGGFATFHEWTEHLGISRSRADDLILWYLRVLPQLKAAGISEERIASIEESKWRNANKWFKEPMPREEVERAVRYLEVATYRDVLDASRPPRSHEPPPQIVLTVTRKDGHYLIRGRLDADQMELVSRRLRPHWVDPDGNTLQEP